METRGRKENGMRGPQAKAWGQPLEAREEKETDSSLASQEGTKLADILTLAQWNWFWTSNIQYCKTINMYFFKPLNMW